MEICSEICPLKTSGTHIWYFSLLLINLDSVNCSTTDNKTRPDNFSQNVENINADKHFPWEILACLLSFEFCLCITGIEGESWAADAGCQHSQLL